MASSPDTTSMALFCDFENVALGVRDAKYEKFDIKKVLERLLLKGSIVVKKAYCDWDRYKGFKATMHEANFELIEIPHVRQSGKNSADIRLVVDALDLCYTKSHVNTFVIISGDSDFSPLVSKLRENAKQVIGVGVKQSTSDLLIANCDEFIFYDDLVRESQRAQRQAQPEAHPAQRRSPEEERRRREDAERRRKQALDIVVETFEALVSDRADGGKVWASVVKDAIKRRKPDFSESYYGFRNFRGLLEEAQTRGLLELGRDEKSNAYVFRSASAHRHEAVGHRHEAAAHRHEAAAPLPPAADDAAPMHVPADAMPDPTTAAPSPAAPPHARTAHAETADATQGASAKRGRGRGGRKPAATREPAAEHATATEAQAPMPAERIAEPAAAPPAPAPQAEAPAPAGPHTAPAPDASATDAAPADAEPARKTRAPRKSPARKAAGHTRRPRKAADAG